MRISSPDSDSLAGDEAARTEGLTSEDVRSRALLGTILLTLRGFGLQIIGLGATIVVAHYLAPEELGKVAFGLALTTFLAFVGGSQGLAGSLIRRQESPDKEELRAVTGLQLVVGCFIAGITTLVALPFGEVGALTSLMVWAIPIAAFRVPALVVLERRLAYGRIVFGEAAEAIIYQAWTVGTIVAGFGVWGLASATLVRAIAGTVALVVLSPMKLILPRFNWHRSKGVMRLGVKIQAVEFVDAIRDQGINFGAGAIGGLSVLGLWSMAFRALQIPLTLFISLFRVSFPAMSRLVSLGEDPKPLIQRFVDLIGPAAGFLLVPLAASSPALFGALLGEKWAGAAAAVPPACLGMLILMTVSVAGVGYLWAIGDGNTPLRSTIWSTVTWFLVTLPLLPTLGVAAVGIGMMVANVVQAAIVARAVRRRVDVSFVRPVGAAALLATIAFAIPWAVALKEPHTITTTVIVGSVSVVIYGTLLWLFRRDTARAFLGYALRPLNRRGRRFEPAANL